MAPTGVSLRVRLKVGEIFADFARIRCTNLAICINTVGMEDKKRSSPKLSQKEIDLIENLRRNPKVMERIQHILEMTNAAEGPLKTADQIEDLLVAELRLLGNDTMTEWLSRADKQVGQELKAKDKSVLKRKKKR